MRIINFATQLVLVLCLQAQLIGRITGEKTYGQYFALMLIVALWQLIANLIVSSTQGLKERPIFSSENYFQVLVGFLLIWVVLFLASTTGVLTMRQVSYWLYAGVVPVLFSLVKSVYDLKRPEIFYQQAQQVY
ncbi:MAG: hypothetical protein ACRCYO_02670 [Bacteroidia bacterium]